jgi:hypothetical protein
MVEAGVVGDSPDLAQRLDGGGLARIFEPESSRRHYALA